MKSTTDVWEGAVLRWDSRVLGASWRDAWTDVTRVGRDGVLRVEAASKTSNGRVTGAQAPFGYGGN